MYKPHTQIECFNEFKFILIAGNSLEIHECAPLTLRRYLYKRSDLRVCNKAECMKKIYEKLKNIYFKCIL